MPTGLGPVDIWPFIAALAAALGGMVFGRYSHDSRPFSLVSAVLYAVAVAAFLLGVIAWFTR